MTYNFDQSLLGQSRWYRLSFTYSEFRSRKSNFSILSFDVINLYTNISHDLRIEAIQFWLEKHPNLIHKRFSKEFILEGIKGILENNNFVFDDMYYNQIRGTAMGTKFAPTYATLVLAYLEEKLYTQLESVNKDLSEYVKHNRKRFLGDCFIIWINSEQELHNKLNYPYTDIKFTIEQFDYTVTISRYFTNKEG